MPDEADRYGEFQWAEFEKAGVSPESQPLRIRLDQIVSIDPVGDDRCEIGLASGVIYRVECSAHEVADALLEIANDLLGIEGEGDESESAGES